MPAVGLTLGKFAPLHRGHQLVIETALSECDHVVVLVYDAPGVTDVPVAVRARWIEDLYPRVEVVRAWGGPEEVGLEAGVMRRHEAYVLGLLGGRRITAFYSSEPYGAHMSAALGAADRRVDPERARVPVSGTKARRDPFACRPFIHPRVYRDLVTNAVLLGAPCTGKTTLARALAGALGTVFMPEYGREYWEAHQVDRRLSPDQLVAIAEGHIEREEALLYAARGALITDTNALTTYVFAQAYHGGARPRLAALADAATHRYQVVFLCETDIPYDATWDRSGAEDREVMRRRTRDELAARGVPHVTLRGSLEERLAEATAVLRAHRPYGNVVDTVREAARARGRR